MSMTCPSLLSQTVITRATYTREDIAGILAEDLVIKKNSLHLEQRCTTARAYLSPRTDSYTLRKLVDDDEFFDLRTR